MLDNRRIVGLDAWRAVLLVLGVCMHAANDPHGWEQWFSVVTHKFRMEAFFAISGLLAAFTLPQQHWTVWLSRRWMMLGVPTLVILLLNTPTTVLVALGEQRRLDQAITMPKLHMPIIHLWFLIVLLACNTLLAMLRTRPQLEAGIYGAIQRFCDTRVFRSQWILIILLCVIALSTAWLEQAYLDINIAAVTNNRIVELAMFNFRVTGARVPYYFLFYFLGWLIGTKPDIAVRCLSRRRLLVALVGLGALVIAYTHHYFGDCVFPYEKSNLVGGGRMFGWVTKALIAVPATLLVLSHATLIKRVPLIVSRFSAASYTIYLLHYFILSVLWVSLGDLGWGTTARFVLTVMITLALGYTIHFQLVDRYPLLGYLLNGKGRIQDLLVPRGNVRRPA